MGLTAKAQAFLLARDFAVEQRARDFLVAEQPGLGDEPDRTCVWVLTQDMRAGRQPVALEAEYLSRFEGIAEKYPGARLHLLVDTLEGLTTGFRTEAKRQYGVAIQVPAQFFDMLFKHEAAKQATSVVAELVREAELHERRRVPQAYEVEGGDGEGTDLAEDLLREMEATDRNREPRVWFVVAPAGHGKSILFRSLFGRVYRRFREKKNELVLYPRPLPMIAEHLRESAGPNLRGLIDAFLRTDVAIPATRRLFDWMVANRHAAWLIDGLDEVITRDDDFFTYIAEQITAPGACPAILICVRDSLFRSSDSLSEFLDYYRSATRVFRLKPWDRSALRTYAWIHFRDRAPRPGEADPEPVRRFLQSVDRDSALQELASTPFYADLLIAHTAGVGPGTISATQLLDVAVSEMCRREYEKKGPLREDVLPLQGFREWLEELAAVSYDGGGVSVDALRALADLVPVFVSRDLSEEESRSLIDQMTRAPFLTQSPASGRLDFTHELLTEYLAARRFAREFLANSRLFASRLSRRQWPPDSMLFPVLAEAVRDRLDEVVALAVSGSLPPDGLRNLIQLLVLIPGADRVFRERRIQLDGARLQGVRFRELNLAGVSFRSCDLSHADFTGSSLRGAHFEGAVLKNTRFTHIPESGLTDTAFGNCGHFESAIVGDRRRIDDARAFLDWVAKQRGIIDAMPGPCPATRQVLHLFRKFVHVDGQGRRDWLDRRGILRGAQVPGAPPYEKCLDVTLDFGYLEPGQFDQIRRVTGPKYGEIVTLVKSGVPSPGLRSLLDTLCRVPGCRHTGT